MNIEKKYKNWVLNYYKKYALTGIYQINVDKMLNVSEKTKIRILRILEIIELCNNDNKHKINSKDFIENKAIYVLCSIINIKLNAPLNHN